MALSPPILNLGPEFYDEVQPAPFPAAQLRYRNQEAAQEIGLGDLSEQEWFFHFAEFKPLPHNLTHPLALRYHGHQFTSYNPELGDGRGFLFAQISNNKKLWDLGTKGTGKTPYSRGGDGRLTLKGAFREILATELLQSYGVNTSRTLSVFETGESLVRHDEPSPTRAGVLVRLSHSHIRFGTFQRLAFLGQTEALKQLTSYCLENYFPELPGTASIENFFLEVSKRSAQTVAEWMMTGFVHGVMNTDNMNITGESFDYGPYRFLPTYDLGFTAAYFDTQGLYSYGRQPIMMLWNLEQFSKALQSAWPEASFTKTLEDFSEFFHQEAEKKFLKRLNLEPSPDAENLLSAFFHFLQETQAGFEQTFFDLHSGLSDRLQTSPQQNLYQHPAFTQLQEILGRFKITNPALAEHAYFKKSKPCTLLIDELEKIWEPIAKQDNWLPFKQKLESIRELRGIYE